MKQGTDRSRGYHGTGQPVMHRHYTVFCKTDDTANIEDDHQSTTHIGRENTCVNIISKIQAAGQHIDKNHCRQQQTFGCGGQVDNILACPGIALLVLVVGDQRIGTDGNNLVEEIHGKKIICKGDSHGSKKRKRETGIKARLCMLIQRPHIAHGIKCRHNPEERGNKGKYHGKGIRPKGKG